MSSYSPSMPDSAFSLPFSNLLVDDLVSCSTSGSAELVFDVLPMCVPMPYLQTILVFSEQFEEAIDRRLALAIDASHELIFTTTHTLTNS